MPVDFSKFHALKNDFLVIEVKGSMASRRYYSRLAKAICSRRDGVGADGIVCLSKSRHADARIDIFNSDGSWAEKSGNGLRIAGLYLHQKRRSRRKFTFETAVSLDEISIIRKVGRSFLVEAVLGAPVFEAKRVPVKTRRKYMINAPLKIGGRNFPVTCLSVGNPHTVLFVDNFGFDWRSLGQVIEVHPVFLRKTNVEFVRIVNSRKIEIADWERGAGATGSSGTGAAAAVAAGVIMGMIKRKCKVVFENGSFTVEWSEKHNNIILTGPVTPIACGQFEF